MSDDPFNSASPLNNERVKASEADDQSGAVAPALRHHKSSGFRNFFRKGSPSSHSNSPRSGANAGISGETPHSTRSADQEMEDHMEGSIYAATDICNACGFPRGSSVGCPVTRLHHGTDEVITCGSRHHSRSSSSSVNFLAKMWKKLPLTPQRRSSRPTPKDDDSVDSTAEVSPKSVAPVNYTVDVPSSKASSHPCLPEATTSGRDENMDLQQGSGERKSNPTAQPQSSPSAGDEVDEVDWAAETEAEVQYYCYTDENGDVYYYAQELKDSVPSELQQHPMTTPAHATQSAANAGDDAVLTGQSGAFDTVLAGTYLGSEAAAKPHEDYPRDESAAPSAVTTRVGSNVEADAAEELNDSVTRKPPKNFLSSITGIFKARRAAAAREQHVDPSASTDDGEGGVVVNPNSGSGENAERTRLDTAHTVDGDVDEFAQSLDAVAKKKFMKDYKRLVKDVLANEKKVRDTLVKLRYEEMEELGWERRAGAFALRADERVIKNGQKRGEPL